MPQLDEEKMATLKIMDLNNPPTKPLAYAEFPRVIYRHPKDKAKEGLAKTVQNKQELDAALKAGWVKEPHIPVFPEVIPEGFE